MPTFSLVRFLPVLLVSSLFQVACSANKEKNKELEQMKKSIQNSTKLIETSTSVMLKSIDEKTKEPATEDRARIWLAKANKIVELSNNLCVDLELTKQNFKKDDAFNDSLYHRLTEYKQSVLLVDPRINEAFEDDAEFSYLDQKPTSPGILGVIENNIRVIENKIVAFCHTNIGTVDGCGFEVFSAIVGQNSSVLKPGEVLEVKAGIGSFSQAALPKITIDGRSVELREEGYALFKKKVQTKPGSYKVPVIISFFNQMTGKDEVRSVNIEYTVAKECDQ